MGPPSRLRNPGAPCNLAACHGTDWPQPGGRDTIVLVRARRLGRQFTAGLLIAALPVAMIAGPASAQFGMPSGMGMTPSMGAMGAPSAEPVLLTDEIVVHFIETFPAVMDGARIVAGAAPTTPPGDVFSALAASASALGQVNAIVTPHGYADFGAWTGVFISISTAIAMAAMDAQTRAMVATMAGLTVPEENIAAVTPHMDALEELLN
jgi:hypothetical protein